MQHSIACPICRDAGLSTTNPLNTRQGESAYFCNAGHKFNDTADLMARQPANLPFVPPKPKPRVGDVKFEVNLPPALLGVLQSKYSTRLDSVARFFLEAMTEDGSFVVNNTSAEQLKVHFDGQKPDSAQKLLGMVWSLKKDRDDAREELKTAGGGKPGGSGAQSGIALDFDDGVLVTLRAKASEQKLSLRSFLEQVITGALDKNWI